MNFIGDVYFEVVLFWSFEGFVVDNIVVFF